MRRPDNGSGGLRGARIATAIAVGIAALGTLVGCGPAPTEPASDRVGLPDLEECDPVRTQDSAAVDLELEIYAAIAERRAAGVDCGSRGRFAPASTLVRNGALICAARLHSDDMLARDFVDHEDPDDVKPWARLEAVDYVAATADEVVAGTWSGDGFDGGTIVETLWLTRDGSCAALMAAPYVHIGVGVSAPPEASEEAAIDRTYTVLVAKPRP